MDFVLSVGDEELRFTQFNDLIGYIERHLAQWNNFGGEPQVLMIRKEPSKTETIGVSTSEIINVEDLFGGMPEGWSQKQKDEFLKIKRILSEKGEKAVQNYLRNRRK